MYSSATESLIAMAGSCEVVDVLGADCFNSSRDACVLLINSGSCFCGTLVLETYDATIWEVVLMKNLSSSVRGCSVLFSGMTFDIGF